MIQTCLDLFKNREIRKKILFTLAMLAIYRLGAAIPVPGVDSNLLSSSIRDNSILSMMNLLGGGTLQRLSIFALGVSPYITASIIIQLLSMDVIPYLTELSKSGQTGRVKLDKITRYLGVVLSFVQAFTMVLGFDRTYHVMASPTIATYIYTATVLTAGTMFLLWIGDRITQFGVGNGISIIIFAGIVANMPANYAQIFAVLVDTTNQTAMFNGLIEFALYIVMNLLIIVLVIVMQLAVRKIPVQYTSSGVQRGRNDMTYIPFKINSASVIPVIFAQAIITAPQIVLSFVNYDAYQNLSSFLSLTKPFGLTLYVILTILFTFFYTNLQVNPEKVAESLGKSGAFIPGVRPGNETKEYLKKVLNRITVLGALGLTIIAVIPYLLPMITNLPASTAIGGTGIIIVVGVAMETMSQLKGQLTQKQYHGFLK